MAEPTILLEGRGIDKFFGKGRQRRQVLFGVDITVYAGECLAVIGGSGSGKTTLTRVLLGLEDADAGDIRYRGEVLRKQTAKSLRSQSGLVFQNPFDSLDPRWRVSKSVMEPLRLRHHDWSPEQISARVDDAFLRVSLDPTVYRNRFPMDLSGGQAQRAAIARAIVDHPTVLLADEPMSAIDVAARVQILESFKAIRAAEPEMALIMVSHDLGVVQHIADRIMVVHDGHAVEIGTAAQVLEHPKNDYTKRLVDAASM